MSDLQYTVQLVDEITGPAKLAQSHLAKLQAHAKAAGESLDFSKQARASINALASLKLDPKGFLAAHEATKKLAEEQRKIIRQHEGFGGGLKSALSGVGSQFTGVALGELAAEGVMKGAETLLEVFAKGAELVKEGITLAFESGGKQEHLQNSFKYIFGGEEAAKEALEQADRFSTQLPFGGVRAAGYLGDLGRAGIKGQSAANSLALAADAGALSPNGQGTDEALYALERLKRHGEFSPRLAEGLNLNLTDFYAALGKKLNLSAAEAQKKLSQPGAIGFNTIQNTLLDLHQKSIGGALTGSPAIEQSQELLARWEKIKELPEEYLRNVANAPGWKQLSDALGRVLAQLDPNSDSGRAIIGSLSSAFSELAGKVSDFLQPKNIQAFVASIETAGKGLEVAAHWAGELVTLFSRAAGFAETLTAPLRYIMDHTGKGSGVPELDKLVDARNQGLATPQDIVDYFSKPEHHDDFAKLDSENRATVLSDLQASTPRAPAGTNVTVPQINVSVTVPEGAAVDEHTGKAVGEAVYRHINNFVERAATEDGE